MIADPEYRNPELWRLNLQGSIWTRDLLIALKFAAMYDDLYGSYNDSSNVCTGKYLPCSLLTLMMVAFGDRRKIMYIYKITAADSDAMIVSELKL